MAAAQATENHGDGWGLIWYLWRGIYTSVPTSQNLQEAAEGVSSKIYSHGTSLRWSWRPFHKPKNSPRLRNEKGWPVLSL